MEKVRIVTFRGTEDEVKNQEAHSRPFGILNPIKDRPKNYPGNTCEVEIEDATGIDLEGKPPFEFMYENWKGEISKRKVIPLITKYTTNQFHGDKPLWLLKAYDLDKCAIRYFDMSKMNKGGV